MQIDGIYKFKEQHTNMCRRCVHFAYGTAATVLILILIPSTRGLRMRFSLFDEFDERIGCLAEASVLGVRQ